MKRVSQIFLAAFLTDGLLSLAAIPVPSLIRVQAIFAFLVFLAAALLHLLMMLSTHFPKRILLPATIFVIWCALTNAFPSGLVFGSHAQLLLSLAQTLLGIGLLLVLRGRPSVTAPLSPPFSWPNFFAVLSLNGGLALVLIVLLLLSGVSMVEERTSGYVHIRPQGISLEERWFQRGDGKIVRLVGMVHIAKNQFYEDLRKTLPEKDSTIVLLEGVTDHDDLLRKKLNYSGLAETLGLTSQTDSEFMKKAAKKSFNPNDSGKEHGENSGIQYWQADVDVSDFQASTLNCIESAGSIFASKTLVEAVQKLIDPKSPLNQEENQKVFWDDVLELRNEHLISEIEKALLRSNTVVVPWGAFHMPVLEQKLKDWGFQETYRVRHLALSFHEKNPVTK